MTKQGTLFGEIDFDAEDKRELRDEARRTYYTTRDPDLLGCVDCRNADWGRDWCRLGRMKIDVDDGTCECFAALPKEE